MKIFRFLALMEGSSLLLLLCVGRPLKYVFNVPGPNFYIGLVHGILFLLYVCGVFMVREGAGWGWVKTGLALLAGILPFGTFVADRKLFSKKKPD
jgi:integral membrane protein